MKRKETEIDFEELNTNQFDRKTMDEWIISKNIQSKTPLSTVG